MNVRDAHVLCRTCIQLLTTSSSTSSSHLHAGDEVVVGPDGEKRVLKPWPQVIAIFGLQTVTRVLVTCRFVLKHSPQHGLHPVGDQRRSL